MRKQNWSALLKAWPYPLGAAKGCNVSGPDINDERQLGAYRRKIHEALRVLGKGRNSRKNWEIIPPKNDEPINHLLCCETQITPTVMKLLMINPQTTLAKTS